MAPRLFSTPNSRYCTRSGSAITANGSKDWYPRSVGRRMKKHHLGDSTVRNLLVPVGEAAQVQVADRTGREPPKLQVCPSGRSRDVHRLIVDVLQTASRHGRTAGQSVGTPIPYRWQNSAKNRFVSVLTECLGRRTGLRVLFDRLISHSGQANPHAIHAR